MFNGITNTNLENSNQNINNNFINNPYIDNLIKNSISKQLISFKEDILEEVKQLETQMFIKYKINQSKNDTKIIKMQETVETIQQNLEKIISGINNNPILDRTDKLSDKVSKLEQTVNNNDLKIKDSNKKLVDDIFELNNKITQNIFNPLVSASNGKYKTFHEFIDFIISNMNNLIIFKEKSSSLHKELKNKTETNMNNFRIKLDYLSHNYINFISASFKDIEQKTKNDLNETLNVELEKINKNFENNKNNIVEKILNINKKIQKIETLEQNYEKIESEVKKVIKLNQEIEKKLNKKMNKHYINSRNTSIIINQNIKENLKNNKLYKKFKSLEKDSSKLKDINDNISKFIKNRREIKTDPNIESVDEGESSISEDSEFENDIELRKNKIKYKINNLPFYKAKTYKILKKGKSKYISNFLPLLSQKIIPLSEKEKNNINNKIKLIKDNQNIAINKNLLNNTNIKKDKEISDKNSLSNTLKKQGKENLLSLKYLIYNQKSENKEQNSLSFGKSSYDRLFLNLKKKINNRKRKNTCELYNKKQNLNDKLNKSQFNKIVMDFSDFKEKNKEKEELKMMKIFYDLKDVIQEDEKNLIKKRFINYGFKRDIIFVRDKRDIVSRNEKNKNNILKINNNSLKVRPNSKSFIKH